MSDLIIRFDGVRASPRACIEAPPPSGVDPCQLTLPMVDDADPTAAAHHVRFDRQGDQFILSPSNPGDTLTWVASHPNLPEVLETLRITQSLLRGNELGVYESATRIFFFIANYVATGEARSMGVEGEVLDRSVVASGLLETFTDSGDRTLTDFMGRLTYLRGQDWLSPEARERLRWVVDVMDFGPQYRSFRRHFISEEEYARFDSLPEERREQLQAITNFCRQTVVAHGLGQPMRFSRAFLAANSAYQALYAGELEAGTRLDFCTSVEDALRELRGDRGLPPAFMEECHQALRLIDMPPAEAVRESLRASLLSTSGTRRLQDSIAEESEDANMTVEWLARQGDEEGGRIGQVADVLLRHLQVRVSEEEGVAPEISLDVTSVAVELNLLIDAQTVRRREYILAALALLRTLFGTDGEGLDQRVFAGGEYREISWTLTASRRGELAGLIRSIDGRLGSSEAGTDIWLPILEGAVCAVGVAGLALSETLPQIRDDRELRLGLGTASAGLTGLGCASLAGHWLWPAVAPDAVHNSYLWDGLTGLGGALIGGGLYLLISLLGGGQTPPMGSPRFPVDEYGP